MGEWQVLIVEILTRPPVSKMTHQEEEVPQEAEEDAQANQAVDKAVLREEEGMVMKTTLSLTQKASCARERSSPNQEERVMSWVLTSTLIPLPSFQGSLMM